MRVGFFVGSTDVLRPEQSSTTLVQGALARGHEVFVVPAEGLSVGSNALGAQAFELDRGYPDFELLWRMNRQMPVDLDLETLDLVVLRCGPSGMGKRPPWTALLLQVAEALAQRGIPVINRPGPLAVAGTKALLSLLPPDFVAPFEVTSDRERIRAFAERYGDVVVKPSVGSQGRGVFALPPGETENRAVILDTLLRDGPVVVQQRIRPEVEGDVRVLMFDGEVLRVGGQPATLRRRPAPGEFRSNLHAGGVAEVAQLPAPLLAGLDGVAARLASLGLRLCGADVVGDRIVEINAWCPGGFTDLGATSGISFAEGLFARLEAPSPLGPGMG